MLTAAHTSRRLRDVPAGGVDNLVRVAAEIAGSLAALEARGIVHGDVHAGHVLVDESGSARLCGFAAGGRVDDGFDPATDVHALGRLILDELQRLGPRGDAESRQWLTALASRAIAGQLSAADVATELRARPRTEPQRVLGGLRRAQPVKIRPERRLTVRLTGIGVVAILGVALAVVVPAAFGRGHVDRPDPAPPPTAATPRAFTYVDGVLETDKGRWAIGGPGDLVALGDWDCDGTPTPALLHPPTGAAYEFERWAESDQDVAARPLGTVTGATSLRATDVDSDGCDDVVAERVDAEPVVLRPRDDR